MDFLPGTATPLQSSSSAFNASATPLFNSDGQDQIGGDTKLLGASTIITVNSTADVVNTGVGVTTLRDAINFANADTGEDVIEFDSSLFASPQTISLSLGELSITHSLSIIAPRDSLTGADLVTVSGNNATRVFEIGSGATVTLSGLEIANGLVTNDDGGGIKNSGTLTLDNSIVRNDSASRGGGIANSSGAMLTVNNSTLGDNTGAGIFNNADGTLEVSNSTISGNTGIGISNSGTANVSYSTISSNRGGISNSGTANVSYSTISGNTGGISNSGIADVSYSTLSNNSAQYGGGIYNYNFGGDAIIKVSYSTITSNSARSYGGGIYNSNGTFQSGTVSNNRSTVEVSNSTLTDNSAQYGGGIFNGILEDAGGEDSTNSTVVVNNSTLSNNSARSGGGIDSSGSGAILTVSDSTLEGNTAVGNGGGINNSGDFLGSTLTVSNSTISSNTAQAGGGIYNLASTLTVSNSTISGNTAQSGGGIGNFYGTLNVSNSMLSDNSATFLLYDGGYGGGINNSGIVSVSNSTISGNSANGGGGGISNSGTVSVSNSTISGNSAGNNGGGIFNGKSSIGNSDTKGGTVSVSNSTISGNLAANNGGGIFNNRTLTLLFSTLTLNQAANGGGVFNLTPGSARVRNTIIASNLFSADGLNPDVAGSFTSNGYNLIGDGTSSSGFAATGDIVGTSTDPIDPRLSPLSANGGSTQTHALLEDSPAIDAGDPTLLDTDPTTDQRGLPRVSGERVDIGAFEFFFA